MLYTHSMGYKRAASLVLLIFFSHAVKGQEAKPLIQINPFSIEGIGTEESRLIASLVHSYLSDIGNVVGNAVNGSRAPREAEWVHPLSPSVDYTINGTIRLEPDGHVFVVEITNTKTGESYSVSSMHKNSGEIVLKARSFLESAFAAGGLETERRPASRPERPVESQIIGTWRPEAGMEMVRLMQGGKGLAIFSSGAQMVLSYSIEGNNVIVKQISPNSERYYYPLPIEAARQLAQGAEPMSWELMLYQRGTVLSGTRVSTAARVSGGTVRELVPNGDVREVFWTKIGP